MALVDGDFYVANSDAVVRFPYTDGETRIAAAGTKLVDLPAGPINHHWTKSLIASPDGSKLYATVGSNSNVAERGMDNEVGSGGDLGDRPQDGRAPRVRVGPAQPERHGLGAATPARCGRWSTSATSWAAIWFPTT